VIPIESINKPRPAVKYLVVNHANNSGRYNASPEARTVQMGKRLTMSSLPFSYISKPVIFFLGAIPPVAVEARAVVDLVGAATAADLRAADRKRQAPFAPIAVLKAMLGEAERLEVVREVVKARGAGRMNPCTAAAERRRMVLENFMVLLVGRTNSKQRATCLLVLV
jgi:hypothetical protein